MIEPILLNKNGEKLNDYPNSEGGDKKRLSNPIGVHAICSGWVDIGKISETHKAIACRGCHLRIVIPKEIKTYGDLRKHLIKQINEEEKGCSWKGKEGCRCEDCGCDVIYNLDLDQIKNYMLKNSWKFKEFSEYLDKAIYSPLEEIFYMIPKNQKNSDYSHRINQLIDVLSKVHKIKKSTLYNQIIALDNEYFLKKKKDS